MVGRANRLAESGLFRVSVIRTCLVFEISFFRGTGEDFMKTDYKNFSSGIADPISKELLIRRMEFKFVLIKEHTCTFFVMR